MCGSQPAYLTSLLEISVTPSWYTHCFWFMILYILLSGLYYCGSCLDSTTKSKSCIVYFHVTAARCGVTAPPPFASHLTFVNVVKSFKVPLALAVISFLYNLQPGLRLFM